MSEEINDLIKNMSEIDANRLLDVHKKLIALSEVSFRIFPIYIRYLRKDKILAILYFNKKNFLDFGLNLRKKPQNPKFKDASYMKYPGIKYSIVIENINELTEEIINQL